ncbi:16849_t:CDS:2, partial [Gigaspora margarita]
MSSIMTEEIQFITISPEKRSDESFNEDDELLMKPPYPYPLAFTRIEDLIFSSNSPRSQAKRKKNKKPPRPQNAWILFLKNFYALHESKGIELSGLASEEDKKIKKQRRSKNPTIQFESHESRNEVTIPKNPLNVKPSKAHQFSKSLENKSKDKQNSKPRCNKNRAIQFGSPESHNEVTTPKYALNVNSNDINFSSADFSFNHELISNSSIQFGSPESHNEVTKPKDALNVNSNDINFSSADFSFYAEYPIDDHELISNSSIQFGSPESHNEVTTPKDALN